MEAWIARLKQNVWYQTFRNNGFIIVIGIVLGCLVITHWIYLIIMCGYFGYVYHHSRRLFWMMTVCIAMILCHYLAMESRTELTDSQIEGVVIEIKSEDTFQQMIVKTKFGKVLIYDAHQSNIAVGDYIAMTCEVKTVDGSRIMYGFDYPSYLKHKHIVGVYTLIDYTFCKRVFSLAGLSDVVHRYINRSFTGLTHAFVSGLLLGDGSFFSDAFNESLKINGTMHLFAISGLHIGFFVAMLSRLFQIYKVKASHGQVILFSFLGLYMIITNFAPSIVRASLMFGLLSFNKRYTCGLSSLDIASITFIFVVVLDPYMIYQWGFILSFMVCFIILLSQRLIKNHSPVIQTLFISAIVQIAIFPITILMNQEINLLSPIVNVLFIFLIQFVMLPFTIFVFLFSFASPLFEMVALSFSEASIFTSQWLAIPIQFGVLSSISMGLYYFIGFMWLRYFKLKRKRWIMTLILSLFLVCLNQKQYLYPDGEVIFLDLYYGESIIISSPFGKCQAVIDTGSGQNHVVTTFLKQKGITHLDYLILTHNHVDHNGEAQQLLDSLTIDHLIVSAYDDSTFRYYPQTQVVQAGDIIECHDIKMHVIHPQEKSNDVNDQSIVILANIGPLRFMFLGDATTAVENQLVGYDVDVVKIGHHGSKAATSSHLIASLSPLYAIISTGRVTSFGFPHSEVIDILQQQNVCIYRTDIDYSIIYRYRFKQYEFKTWVEKPRWFP